MTVKEAIDTACAIKPNAFPRSALIGRLNECEGQVLTDVFDIMPGAVRQYRENTETDPTAEDEVLTVPHPFCKIYVTYLTAMLDFDNGEYDKYQNTMTLFNHQAEDFAKWYIRTHERDEERVFNDYMRLYNYVGPQISKEEWAAERKNIRHIGIYTVEDWGKLDADEEGFTAEIIIADNLLRNIKEAKASGDLRDAKAGEDITDLKKWVLYATPVIDWILNKQRVQFFATDTGAIYKRNCNLPELEETWEYSPLERL